MPVSRQRQRLDTQRRRGSLPWHRPADRFGLAAGLNGINRDHRDYLAHGGYGFMLGDGRLTYAAERVVDATTPSPPAGS